MRAGVISGEGMDTPGCQYREEYRRFLHLSRDLVSGIRTAHTWSMHLCTL